jgi:chlorobactene glucosyltransferase
LTVPLLLALPWLLLILAFFGAARLPRSLPAPEQAGSLLPDPAPFVSVVIPARNEARNIVRVLASVVASRYPRFEVIVVNDQSEDETGALARTVGRGAAERTEVVDGRPLPAGWLGKPWTCAQGASLARGELILFTDADTVHAPDLLARAVAGLHQDRADLLTILGRQLMESFWERLVQPSVFVMMAVRFPDATRPLPAKRWRSAIANGQYLLFRRSFYDALGGHDAVHHEVVEDLRLAQIVVQRGGQLSIRRAEEALATRMYAGLGELIGGWSKNIATGAMLTMPPWTRPLVMPLSLLGHAALWLVPPAALAAASLGAGGPALLTWSAMVVGISAAFWAFLTSRMGAPPAYGLLYPLGALVSGWILLRSWVRGRRVEWKGREYRIRPLEG